MVWVFPRTVLKMSSSLGTWGLYLNPEERKVLPVGKMLKVRPPGESSKSVDV